MKKINYIYTAICCFILVCYNQNVVAQACTVNFETDGDMLFGDIMPNAGDIANFDVPTFDAGCFNVLDENICTCPLTGGGGADDVCLMFEIEPIVDIYGGITTPYDGGTALQITHEGTGIRGTIPMGDVGVRDVSTGDVICYSVTVNFAPHLVQRACDVAVNTTSINTAGEGFESTSITFLDGGGAPYGVATYNGFYVDADGPGGTHPGIVAACPAAQPTINPDPWTFTGTGVWIADDTGTVTPLAGDACETVGGASGPENNGDPTGVDAGLMPCDPVGGFVFRVCLENIETATVDGVGTPIATSFTNTLNGFDAVLSCCPEINTVTATDATVCELGTEISSWQAAIETVGAGGATSAAPVAPTTVSYLYSSNATYAGVYTATEYNALTFDAEPAHAHSGVGCASEMETTYGYVICDRGEAACADGTVCETDRYEISLVSEIDLTFFPPAQLPTITRDDDVCAYTIMPACPNDVLTPATFGPETPGVDPAAFTVTVTTADGCTDMLMLDPEACPLPAVPSIAVDKDDADDTDDTQTVIGGADATFTITVTNDGTVPLENIVLTDALSPACDMDATMTAAAIMAIGNLDAIFDPGEAFTYTCMTTGGVTADFTNSITVDGNAVGDLATTVTATDDTEVIFECAPIIVEALPSCPAVGTDFNIDISSITGGAAGATYTVDGGGLSVNYPGTTTIGPFTYADQNTKITLTVTDDATGCAMMYDVLQLNCEALELCDCTSCATGAYTINAQAAGNGNGFSMFYVLVDGTGNVAAVNTTGNFPNLPDVDAAGVPIVYEVHAINVADADLAAAQGSVAVGAPFDPAALAAGFCADSSCNAMFQENCMCIPDPMLTCPADVDLCGDPVAITVVDNNMNTAAGSTVTYGGTAGPFINTQGTPAFSDDTIDPSLAPGPGTYDLTVVLTSADGCDSPAVMCVLVLMADCDAAGGRF